MSKPEKYHKFDIGDVVKVAFDGTVEGEKVTVQKNLYVIGVWLAWNMYGNPPRWEPKYKLTERMDVNLDKTWDLPENRLNEIEPMISEMKKARDKAGC